MANNKSPASRILIILAQRAGAAVGLALAIALARGFCDSALQAFGEGLAAGLGASVIALVVTGFALVIVYATLGSQVDQVVMRLMALAGGRARQSSTGRAEITAAAWADALATPCYIALGALLVGWGVADAHATWTLLGFAGFALSLLSMVSSVVHFLYRSRMGARGSSAQIEANHAEKGGEIAGVFISVAVLGLTLSASIFASIPAYRHRGGTWPLAYGDWARVCVGSGDGCVPAQVMAFEPEGGRETLLEVASKELVSLRAKGGGPAVDAKGQRVRVVQEKGSDYGWQATFLPSENVAYEVVLDKPGTYSVRYRSAR